MKNVKNCGNCARGIKLNINNDVLCRINGVVSGDYLCSKHLKLAWSSSDRRPKCIECKFFVIYEGTQAPQYEAEANDEAAALKEESAAVNIGKQDRKAKAVSASHVSPSYKTRMSTPYRTESISQDTSAFLMDNSQILRKKAHINPANGYCQLFTVRCYNGETKNACSKFCNKDE